MPDPTEPDKFDGSKTQPIPGLALTPETLEAIELLRQQIINEQKDQELREAELQQKLRELDQRDEEIAALKQRNDLSLNQQSHIRDLVASHEQEVQELRITRRDINDRLDSLSAILREIQDEQARVNDEVLKSIIDNRRDVTHLKDILIIIFGGQPNPDIDIIQTLIRQRRENLNDLKLSEAKTGGEVNIKLRNQIKDEEDELKKLEASLIVASLGGK